MRGELPPAKNLLIHLATWKNSPPPHQNVYSLIPSPPKVNSPSY